MEKRVAVQRNNPALVGRLDDSTRAAICPLKAGPAKALLIADRASARGQPIDEETWIAWRTQLGCRKGEAKALYAEYRKLLSQSTGKVRIIKPRHNETFEQALQAFLDSMPRRPTKFLAMVAEAQRKRALRVQSVERKTRGRARYLRRHKQPFSAGDEHE